MKTVAFLLLAMAATLVGCSSSPRSQDMVRRSTAAVTRTVASDVKGAALGIRDGLKHDPASEAVDVNGASKERLETLPGISGVEAQRIIAGRPYKKPGDLVRRRILTKAEYGKIESRLVAR